MIDSVPLIQNANDAQQINASIIAMKKASRELDEKIVKLNSLNSELDKKIALLDSGLNKEIEDRKEAINSLDVPSVGGSGKYISAISETDGKISATASDITSSVSSGNSQPVTSGGVAEAIIGDTIYNPCYSEGNSTFNIDTVGAGHRVYARTAVGGGTSGNCPSDYGIVYTVCYGTAWKYQVAFATYSNIIYTRMNTNNEGWTPWLGIASNKDVDNCAKQILNVGADYFGYSNGQSVLVQDFIDNVCSRLGSGNYTIKFVWSYANNFYIQCSDGNTFYVAGGTMIGFFQPNQPWMNNNYIFMSDQGIMYTINVIRSDTTTVTSTLRQVTT